MAAVLSGLMRAFANPPRGLASPRPEAYCLDFTQRILQLHVYKGVP